MAEFREREAVKEQLHKRLKNPVIISWLYSIIAETPAADVVEVVHGEWIESYQPLGFGEVKCAECSSCGEDWIMDDDVYIDDYKAHWKYCPCCGAKMDGDKNG